MLTMDGAEVAKQTIQQSAPTLDAVPEWKIGPLFDACIDADIIQGLVGLNINQITEKGANEYV